MTIHVNDTNKKVAILGDLHFGIKNDSKTMIGYQASFFRDTFFPYLEKNNIKTIIQVGDIVDKRKFINYITLHYMKRVFFDKLKDYTFYGYPGNHDLATKVSTSINSINELLSPNERRNMTWFNTPTEIRLFDKKCLFLPWICDEEKEYTLDIINKSDADIVFGHLELAGFEMQRGYIIEHGMDPNIFRKFKLVISGHYHSQSRRDNIQYTGVPYELSWADYNDPKGFWILDTETLQLEFIKNPSVIHCKIFYNEDRPDFKEWYKWKPDTKNKYIKVIVEKKFNDKLFNDYVSCLEKDEPANIQIIELPIKAKNDINVDITNDSIDLFDIIKDVVNNLEVNDKDTIIKKLKELYDKSI